MESGAARGGHSPAGGGQRGEGSPCPRAAHEGCPHGNYALWKPHTSKSCTWKFSWQSGGLSKVSQCSVCPQSRLASRDRAWPPPPPARASAGSEGAPWSGGRGGCPLLPWLYPEIPNRELFASGGSSGFNPERGLSSAAAAGGGCQPGESPIAIPLSIASPLTIASPFADSEPFNDNEPPLLITVPFTDSDPFNDNEPFYR